MLADTGYLILKTAVSLSYHPRDFLKTVGVFIPTDSFAAGTIGFTFMTDQYTHAVPVDSIIFQSQDHELVVLNDPLEDSLLHTPRARTYFMVLFYLHPADLEFFRKKEISKITFAIDHTTIPIALNRRSRRTIKALIE